MRLPDGRLDDDVVSLLPHVEFGRNNRGKTHTIWVHGKSWIVQSAFGIKPRGLGSWASDFTKFYFRLSILKNIRPVFDVIIYLILDYIEDCTSYWKSKWVMNARIWSTSSRACWTRCLWALVLYPTGKTKKSVRNIAKSTIKHRWPRNNPNYYAMLFKTLLKRPVQKFQNFSIGRKW